MPFSSQTKAIHVDIEGKKASYNRQLTLFFNHNNISIVQIGFEDIHLIVAVCKAIQLITSQKWHITELIS